MKTDQSTKRCLLLLAGLLFSATTTVMAQTVLPERQAAGENGDAAIKANKPGQPRADNEIDLLKAQLAAQQEELNALRKAVDEQGKSLALVLKTNANTPTVAVSSPATASDANQLTGRAAPPPEANDVTKADPSLRSTQAIREEDKPSPLSFRIGTAQLTPFGFIDLTAVIRDKNLGSGIGTNFGAAPFSNTVNGNLRECRFSSQSSRLGLRVDARVRGTDLLGYLENRFFGFRAR